MNTLEKIKLFCICLGTALSSWMGALATPVYILVLLGIIDYCTGLAAAPHRGQERSSYRGLAGIVKKLCILVLVAVAAVVDWVLLYAADSIGIVSPFQFVVASLAAVWLICNEILSILENIGDLGVHLPPFLEAAVKWVKAGTESKGKGGGE